MQHPSSLVAFILHLMKKMAIFGAMLLLLAAASWGVYQVPAVNQRLSWRLDAAWTYVNGALNGVGAAPTPLPTATPGETATATLVPAPTATATIEPTPTPGPTATLLPFPTPFPPAVNLPAPTWEKQDWNNCGPATLSMYLRTFGWEGDQYDIADLLKPDRGDRNVNIDELVYYVRNRAGWLDAGYRVGGNLELLKEFLANGLYIVIEEGYYDVESYWPGDDQWVGHYLLLTGYDDAAGVFITQDTYRGADHQIAYETLDEGWKTFNRAYLFVYLPGQLETIQAILGEAWDPDVNRQRALEKAQAEIDANPEDMYAWFNLGTNLLYFEKYNESGAAYDQARSLGLPQRMFRYQFGPFITYFHSFRLDELMALTEYALQITEKSEEAHLWRGWGFYRQGDTPAALEQFNRALEINPNYFDAQYAVEFVQNN